MSEPENVQKEGACCGGSGGSSDAGGGGAGGGGGDGEEDVKAASNVCRFLSPWQLYYFPSPEDVQLILAIRTVVEVKMDGCELKCSFKYLHKKLQLGTPGLRDDDFPKPVPGPIPDCTEFGKVWVTAVCADGTTCEGTCCDEATAHLATCDASTHKTCCAI